MKNTKDYSALSIEEGDEKSIDDFEEYVDDDDRWQLILTTVRDPSTSYRKWVMACGFFVGVEGRPVEALWRRERGEIPEDQFPIVQFVTQDGTVIK